MLAARTSIGSVFMLAFTSHLTCQLYPLRNAEKDRKLKTRATAEPFPTMYWLIDPQLKIRISRLEEGKSNWVDKLEKRLQEPRNLEVSSLFSHAPRA